MYGFGKVCSHKTMRAPINERMSEWLSHPVTQVVVGVGPDLNLPRLWGSAWCQPLLFGLAHTACSCGSEQVDVTVWILEITIGYLINHSRGRGRDRDSKLVWKPRSPHCDKTSRKGLFPSNDVKHNGISRLRFPLESHVDHHELSHIRFTTWFKTCSTVYIMLPAVHWIQTWKSRAYSAHVYFSLIFNRIASLAYAGLLFESRANVHAAN